jgi:cation diffusion facilitator CzcD-associated flavoprotein CzcO
LWSNGPKECLEFADYSFDEHFNKPIPSFPPREVLQSYILGRAEKSDVKKYVKFNTTVSSVVDNGNGFDITYTNKLDGSTNKDSFDKLVVASGHFSVPYIPEYEGMNSFPGRIMHSHDFRDAEEFRNKNVVVLGSSYSAEDVALQCHKYGAKSVTIGYRNNPMGFNWPDGMKEVHYMDKIDGNKAIFKDAESLGRSQSTLIGGPTVRVLHSAKRHVLVRVLCGGCIRRFEALEGSHTRGNRQRRKTRSRAKLFAEQSLRRESIERTRRQN